MPTQPVPQLLPQFITIGFVGKRLLPGGEAPLRTTLAQVLDQLEAEYPGPNHVLLGLSALALGADTVFAELIAERDQAGSAAGRPAYAQQVFLPAQPEGFFLPKDFCLGDEAPDNSAVPKRVARSRACLATKTVLEVRITGQDPNRNERFAETAYEIVSECDLLLVACTQADYEQALHPDAPGLARGGSAETLRHAHAAGKPVTVVLVDAPVQQGRLPIVPVAPAPLSGPQPSPARQLGIAADGWLFAATAVAPPLAALNYPAVLGSIHTRADALAVSTKSGFMQASQRELLLHLLATLVAALVLTLPFEAWLLAEPAAWVVFGLGGLKLALLLGVLYYVYHHHHHDHKGGWLKARLLAELTRSAQLLLPPAGATNTPPFYPGGPHHLREFYLPELAVFTKSLYMLHLREFVVRTGQNHYATGPRPVATVQALAEQYVAQRLGGTDGQLAFFGTKSERATRRLAFLKNAFLGCSVAAIGFAACALYLHFPHQEAVTHSLLAEWLTNFMPLMLPVAAAGIIAWLGLLDLEREAERYTDMLAYLHHAEAEVSQSSTTAQLRHRIGHLEMSLLQELIEWRAKIKATHAG